MLDVGDIDLEILAQALQDHSPDRSWWMDPRTGKSEPRFGDRWDDADEPAARGLIHIEPIASSEAYGDMEDFIARVRHPAARDLLERAIAGRGAFRRFKDTLLEFPELREDWFTFHDARMEQRAIRWLRDAGLIGFDEAEREIAARKEPVLPAVGPGFDPVEIAARVAEELRMLYGKRLRTVLLFGSRARGDAHPESDIDILVVLDRVDSPWDELRKMDEILWRHSFEHDTVIAAVPAAEAELQDPRRPIVIRATTEGQPVA